MTDKDINGFTNFYDVNIKSFMLPQKLQNEYKIIDCLKKTDGKKIYLLQKSDTSLFVLKEYTLEYLSLAQNEYDILTKLNNVENLPIPKVTDYWHDENHAYILRTYIAGSSLRSMYEDDDLGPGESIIRLALELCAIIAKLHNENPPIIHRDIKPENFILGRNDNKLYLIDCDSARIFKEGQSHDTLFFGTPAHVAPEAYGYAQSNIQSDVYGLGKTLLYMCCGRSDDNAILECSISRDLKKIIKKCIAFSPESRYSNISSVERDLKRLYNHKYNKPSKAVRLKYVLTTLIAVLLSLAAGISIGKQTKSTDSAADDIPKTGLESNNPTVSPSGKPSLEESANRIAIDVSGYKEQVDKIIISYYEIDLDGMGSAYNELFTKLYGAGDLKKLEWTDTSKLSEIPENYPYRPYPYRICDPLACHDNVLHSKTGDFEDYSGMIYGYIDYFLNEDTAWTEHPFYKYCTEDSSDNYECYKEALVEVINCALRGVMDQDRLEFINP